MKFTSLILAGVAALPVAFVQALGPATALAPGSCQSTEQILYTAATPGFRCGNAVTPRMRYANHATILKSINSTFDSCKSLCYNTPLCKALTFEAATSTCTTFAHGGGGVDRDPLLVNPAPGKVFYNRHCLYPLRCFNLQAQQSTVLATKRQTYAPGPSSYDGLFVTTNTYQTDDSEYPFADFETTVGDVGSNHYLLSKGQLVNDKLGRVAVQIAREDSFIYPTLYYLDDATLTQSADAGYPYTAPTCAIDAESNAFACSDPQSTLDNPTTLYGCQNGDNIPEDPINALALGLVNQQAESVDHCTAITLKALYL